MYIFKKLLIVQKEGLSESLESRITETESMKYLIHFFPNEQNSLLWNLFFYMTLDLLDTSGINHVIFKLLPHSEFIAHGPSRIKRVL